MSSDLVPLRFDYDDLTDTLTVEGVRYAGALFRGLGHFPLGARLEILAREGGQVTVRRLDQLPTHSIRQISAINLARCRRWHPEGIQSWSESDWYAALAGEAGEMMLATLMITSLLKMGDTIKKLNRARDGLVGNKFTEPQLRENLRGEIADVYLYLDLLAQRMGYDLAEAIRDKFNEVSDRNGFPERL